MLSLPCMNYMCAVSAYTFGDSISFTACFPFKTSQSAFIHYLSLCLFVCEQSSGSPICLICCKPVIGLSIVVAAAVTSHPAQLKHKCLYEGPTASLFLAALLKLCFQKSYHRTYIYIQRHLFHSHKNNKQNASPMISFFVCDLMGL